jgi:hypothetical protein
LLSPRRRSPGTLNFINGQIAVKNGETTYYVRGLGRLFGFVEGLKEGSTVTLEGYAEEIPITTGYRFLLVVTYVLWSRVRT